VITVGTISPGLTLALVILFLALAAAVAVMACLLSRARGQLYVARREAARSGGRHRAAAEQAREAEEQAARLLRAVEAAVATARRAVEDRDQLEIVGERLSQLLAYVTEPLDALPPGGLR
jgi:Na+-transporting methylmalonyl-CoA/oxaloacetate decarboxylase gamma subunit